MSGRGGVPPPGFPVGSLGFGPGGLEAGRAVPLPLLPGTLPAPPPLPFIVGEGAEPEEALKRLSVWVREHNRGARERPVFVGHNAVFDWAYINYYYHHYKLPNPFGYKGIDSKTLAMGRLGVPWTKTSKEQLQKQLGLPKQDPAQVHRADYDAWYQALILKKLLETESAPTP